jgi:hypothetical protein
VRWRVRGGSPVSWARRSRATGRGWRIGAIRPRRSGTCWLGHAGVRSTDTYVHADISIKERALALTTPAEAKPGRYHPTDKMLAFLEGL